MMTLNQIHKKLIAWFNTHAQINTVKYERDFDFNTHRDLVYPVVNLEWQDGYIQNNMTDNNFRVMLGDLFDADHPEQANEIHSDIMQIAEDFFAFLEREEGWVFSKRTRINPFIDDTADRIAGISFTVTISTVRQQNPCLKPVKNMNV